MIQRRFLGKQVPGAIRSCAPGDFGAVHLAFAGVRQRPIHVAGNRQRVGRLPGLWLVAKQRKLERQVADALLDKLVHAAGVRFEDFARFWVEPRRFLVRGAAEPERAEIFINGKSPGPENFRKLRSEEHTSELQSRLHLVCRLLLEKKKKHITDTIIYSPNTQIDNSHFITISSIPPAKPRLCLLTTSPPLYTAQIPLTYKLLIPYTF